jgi:hypothetical protein
MVHQGELQLGDAQSGTIACAWKTTFGDVAPIGSICRVALMNRWLRIHSLPGSKRYPENAGDYAEMLARQNTAATAVLGRGAEATVFFCEFASEPESRVLGLLGAEAALPIWVPELARLADIDDALRIGACVVRWEPGRFDALLRARADDRLAPVLFAKLSEDHAKSFSLRVGTKSSASGN